MLFDLSSLVEKYSLKIKGVIEVGAHWGEEHEVFSQNGIADIIYIEPCGEAYGRLKYRLGHIPGVTLFNCACGDRAGEKLMYIERSNGGQSNSLLKPMEHISQHSDIIFDSTELVQVRLLDDLVFERENYNFMCMDCQGFEDRVLRGAQKTCKYMDYIYTEVNRQEMYQGNAMVEELDMILFDFKRVETKWASDHLGWGDSLYIRQTLLK